MLENWQKSFNSVLRYKAIANKPSQAKFRRGWYNRINNLAKDYCIDWTA